MRLFAVTIAFLPLALAATAADAQAAHARSPAQAAVAAPQADERCLLAMLALANSGNDENSKGFGQAGVIYFTGRLARDPNFDFGRLKAVAGTMDVKAAQADLQQHCVPEFQRSMQQMQAALAPPKAAAPAPTPPGPSTAAPTAPPVQQLPH